MTSGLVSSERALAEVYDLALVDLDGVAYRGADPIPHAAEGLAGARVLGLPPVFVTNNASREPESIAEQLNGLQIQCAIDDVMTSAQAAAQLLAAKLAPGAKVLVVGGAGLRTAVTNVGLTVVESARDEPQAVVQGFAPDIAWRMLAEATYAIRSGAWFVASNLDPTLPTERGFAPGNGSLVAAVRAATGVDPVSAGKPEPTMYRIAAQRRRAQSPLVVGDRLDTDIAGARAAGWPALHVLTGVSTARDAILATADQRPSYLGRDLRALLEPHTAPHRDGTWWRCGQDAARVRDGRLELASVGGTSLDLVRCACAAAWESADAGSPLDPRTVGDLSVEID